MLENKNITIESIEVKLLDSMGTDIDIDKAARISYAKMEDKRTPEQMKGLIRYLFWHRHTSPFEMVEFKFLIKLPIFVARQMVRHRTANINEISRRYTDVNISFFDFELRTTDNTITKQGSGEILSKNSEFHKKILDLEQASFDLYNELISGNIAKETARIVLPVSSMTQWVWKVDLHNLIHFLNLRWDSHAQKEIQVVAEKLLEAIEPIVPVTVAAFKDWKMMMDCVKEVGYSYFKNQKAEKFVDLVNKNLK